MTGGHWIIFGYLLTGALILGPIWETKRVRGNRSQVENVFNQHGLNGPLHLTLAGILGVFIWPLVLIGIALGGGPHDEPRT